MVKERISWGSRLLQRDVTVVRWGYSGLPVLLIPTAGGDAADRRRRGWQ